MLRSDAGCLPRPRARPGRCGHDLLAASGSSGRAGAGGGGAGRLDLTARAEQRVRQMQRGAERVASSTLEGARAVVRVSSWSPRAPSRRPCRRRLESCAKTRRDPGAGPEPAAELSPAWRAARGVQLTRPSRSRRSCAAATQARGQKKAGNARPARRPRRRSSAGRASRRVMGSRFEVGRRTSSCSNGLQSAVHACGQQPRPRRPGNVPPGRPSRLPAPRRLSHRGRASRPSGRAGGRQWVHGLQACPSTTAALAPSRRRVPAGAQVASRVHASSRSPNLAERGDQARRSEFFVLSST